MRTASSQSRPLLGSWLMYSCQPCGGKASLYPARDPGCVYTPGKDPRNLQVRSAQASLFHQKPGDHPKCQSDHTAQRAPALSTADLASARTASRRVPSPCNCPIAGEMAREAQNSPLGPVTLPHSPWRCLGQAIVWEWGSREEPRGSAEGYPGSLPNRCRPDDPMCGGCCFSQKGVPLQDV